MTSPPDPLAPVAPAGPAGGTASTGTWSSTGHPRWRPVTTGRIHALPTLSPEALFSALGPLIVEPPAFPAMFPLDRLRPHARGERPRALRGAGGGLDGRRAALYYLARNGIYHGLSALGVGPGDAVLMPAWHHGVEVEAVRRVGARVIFYRVDREMRADLDDAAGKSRAAGARVLYLTHYAGFPQNLEEAGALCRARDLLLVEDCALALFSRDAAGRPLGAIGDLAVFCLYKTLPVPHGGLVLAARPPAPGRAPPLLSTAHHLAGLLRAHAARDGKPHPLWDAMRRLAGRTVDRALPHQHTGTQTLDPAQLSLGASRLLPSLLAQADAEGIAARRRKNFQLLAAALGDERGSTPRPLVPGVCPLFFPLLVVDRRRALDALRAAGIEGIDFWSTGDPHALGFAETAWLRRHLIEVPIHQDLDDEAMDRVARAVKGVLAHAGA